MNRNKASIATVFLLLIVLLGGCGYRGKGPTIDKVEPSATPVTQLPTYSPTPLILKEPVASDVVAAANHITPSLSGKFEDVWNYAEKIPLEQFVRGKGDTTAYYQMFWSEHMLYIRAEISDNSAAENHGSHYDSVSVYLNENNSKPAKYGVGDSYCTVRRDGLFTPGTGCDAQNTKGIVYETSSGYAVEFAVPLLTVSGKEGLLLGFDIGFADYDDDEINKIMQWSDKTGRTSGSLRNVGTVTLGKGGNGTIAPLPSVKIDGYEEDLWKLSESNVLENVSWGENGASVNFRTLHDDKLLYLFVHVDDNTVVTDGEVMTRKDSVELFLRSDNESSPDYREGKDMHVRIDRNGVLQCQNGADSSLFEYRVQPTEQGYDVEMAVRIPWNLNGDDASIGFDIHVNDSFSVGQRDYIVTWSDPSLQTYTDMSHLGKILLK